MISPYIWLIKFAILFVLCALTMSIRQKQETFYKLFFAIIISSDIFLFFIQQDIFFALDVILSSENILVFKTATDQSKMFFSIIYYLIMLVMMPRFITNNDSFYIKITMIMSILYNILIYADNVFTTYLIFETISALYLLGKWFKSENGNHKLILTSVFYMLSSFIFLSLLIYVEYKENIFKEGIVPTTLFGTYILAVFFRVLFVLRKGNVGIEFGKKSWQQMAGYTYMIVFFIFNAKVASSMFQEDISSKGILLWPLVIFVLIKSILSFKTYLLNEKIRGLITIMFSIHLLISIVFGYKFFNIQYISMMLLLVSSLFWEKTISNGQVSVISMSGLHKNLYSIVTLMLIILIFPFPFSFSGILFYEVQNFDVSLIPFVNTLYGVFMMFFVSLLFTKDLLLDVESTLKKKYAFSTFLILFILYAIFLVTHSGAKIVLSS